MCIRAIKKIFHSTEEVHWVNHIHDESVFWPNSAAMWCNVHGFDEGPGTTYWIGMDIRTFGIRSADYIIKCKNKETYDKYLDMACHDIEHILRTMKSDDALAVTEGNDLETKFIFKWGGEEKTFNLRLMTDWYAEEK